MKEIVIFLFSLFHLFICTGCEIYSPYDFIMVALPEPPLHWEQRFKEISYSITYPGSNRKRVELILPADSSTCIIRIPKMRNWPVVAQPYGDGFPLCPAGALYPWHLDNNRNMKLCLTWEQGFSALLLLDCCEKGFDIEHFNARRFASEVLERSQGDPWNLDYSYIAEKLVSGSFRVNYIKLLPVKDVSVFTEKGKWFFPSPFSAVYEVEENRPYRFDTISLGFHRLFHCESPGWYELYVKEQETIVVYYEG